MVMEMSEAKWQELSLQIKELLMTTRIQSIDVCERVWKIFDQLRKYENAWPHLARRKPWTIAGAIFFIAVKESGRKITHLELCSMWDISEPCLMDNIKLLQTYLRNIRGD